MTQFLNQPITELDTELQIEDFIHFAECMCTH